MDIPIFGRLKEAEYEKEELLKVFQELCRRGRLDVRFRERVGGVERSGKLLSVRSSSGVTLARFVVLALGRRGTPRKLGVPGEALPKVMYQLVDAESYQGQRLLVVGGGDNAAEAAIGLARQPHNRVTLSYRREKLVRIKKKNDERISELLARGRIEGLFNSEVEEILPGAVRLRTPSGMRTIPNDYVFVMAGGEPPFGLLRQMGVRFGGEASERSPSALGTSPGLISPPQPRPPVFILAAPSWLRVGRRERPQARTATAYLAAAQGVRTICQPASGSVATGPCRRSAPGRRSCGLRTVLRLDRCGAVEKEISKRARRQALQPGDERVQSGAERAQARPRPAIRSDDRHGGRRRRHTEGQGSGQRQRGRRSLEVRPTSSHRPWARPSSRRAA